MVQERRLISSHGSSTHITWLLLAWLALASLLAVASPVFGAPGTGQGKTKPSRPQTRSPKEALPDAQRQIQRPRVRPTTRSRAKSVPRTRSHGQLSQPSRRAQGADLRRTAFDNPQGPAKKRKRSGEVIGVNSRSAREGPTPTPKRPRKAANRYQLPKPPPISGRPDKAKLKRHISSLEKAYLDASLRHQKHAPRPGLTERFAKKYRRIQRNAKARMTEAIGEMNATQAMVKHYPDYRLVTGFAKGTGFDQVWKNPNRDMRDMIVVEAKGPGAKLGISDRKGRQMSRSWVKMTAQSLKKKGRDAGLVQALKNGRVLGLVIPSTASGNRAKSKSQWSQEHYPPEKNHE